MFPGGRREPWQWNPRFNEETADPSEWTSPVMRALPLMKAEWERLIAKKAEIDELMG